MRSDRILILGGTREAHDLASALVGRGHDVITSLAGVTTSPRLPQGAVRRGGFGGVAGLARYLKDQRIAAIADVTHPFAAQISHHAYAAAKDAGLQYVRYERPQWSAESGDRWISVASISEAAAVLPDGARVLLTIGRKEIAPFLGRTTLSGVARMIEPPTQPIPDAWVLLLARPPFALDDELRLLHEHAISHLVTKNAGGQDAHAKLVAARQAGITVVMVRRPHTPGGHTFHKLDDVILALGGLLSP